VKTQFYICMTSGIRGPEGELSEELSKEISELAGRLTEPWDGSTLEGRRLGDLSPTHYAVSWLDKDSPVVSLRTTANGYVTVWRQGDTDWHEYKDTMGIWAKLAPTGSVILQKWYDDMRKAMEDTAPIFKIPGA
jgi:hypothetical protein